MSGPTDILVVSRQSPLSSSYLLTESAKQETKDIGDCIEDKCSMTAVKIYAFELSKPFPPSTAMRPKHTVQAALTAPSIRHFAATAQHQVLTSTTAVDGSLVELALGA